MSAQTQITRSLLRQQRLFDALKRITRYQQPEAVKRDAGRIGLSEEEAVEMAYENVLEEARMAIRGMRRPAPSVLAPLKCDSAARVSSPKESPSVQGGKEEQKAPVSTPEEPIRVGPRIESDQERWDRIQRNRKRPFLRHSNKSKLAKALKHALELSTRKGQIAGINIPRKGPHGIDYLSFHRESEGLLADLKEIENHCPCGARPESPHTHPHVGGCPVERALRRCEEMRLITEQAPSVGAAPKSVNAAGVSSLQDALKWLQNATHQSPRCRQFSSGTKPCVCGLNGVRKDLERILSEHAPESADASRVSSPNSPSAAPSNEEQGEGDTKRLDWIEAHPQDFRSWVNVASGLRWTADNCAWNTSYPTAREAIDAAMERKEPE